MIRRLLATVAVLLASYVALFLVVALSAPSGQADIAVVFGSRVLKDGTPSARLDARLRAVAVAYQRHLTPRILVGGGLGASGYDEATVMKAALVKAGVPESAVLVDSEGMNTAATVRNTMRVVHELGLSRVMVVTQYFHIPRCMLAFHQAGARAIVATFPAFFEPRDVYSIFREMVALPVQAIRLKL